jgi:hypothetical protein
VWQQAVNPGKHTRADAEALCSSLSLAGGGFRLPTTPELRSLVDQTRKSVAADCTGRMSSAGMRSIFSADLFA